ncbi:hypothetical protein BOW43_06365 [Solemya velum gill symbiont]|nr:hypothetical protein BOW43_06365 [Solemya velum gill symbiont]
MRLIKIGVGWRMRIWDPLGKNTDYSPDIQAKAQKAGAFLGAATKIHEEYSAIFQCLFGVIG